MTSESVPYVLVCTYWGMQALSCVERACHFCGAPVALSVENISIAAKLNLLPCCPACFLENTEPNLAVAVIGGFALNTNFNVREAREAAAQLVARRKAMNS